MKKVYYLSLLIIMCLLCGCFDYNELRVLHSRNKEFLFEYYIDYHSVYNGYICSTPKKVKKWSKITDDKYHNYDFAFWERNIENNFYDMFIASCSDEKQLNEYYDLLNKENRADKYIKEGNFIYYDCQIAYLILWGEPLEKDGFLYYELEDNQTLLFGDVCNCASENKNEAKTTIIPDWVEIIGGVHYGISLYSHHSPYADTLIIPDSVVEIRYFAFFATTYKHIKLSKKLKRINSGSFYGMSELEYIVIPKSVEYIGEMAFMNGNIFCEAERKPDAWNENFAVENAKVYYANEWEYDENGEPKVK